MRDNQNRNPGVTPPDLLTPAWSGSAQSTQMTYNSRQRFDCDVDLEWLKRCFPLGKPLQTTKNKISLTRDSNTYRIAHCYVEAQIMAPSNLSGYYKWWSSISFKLKIPSGRGDNSYESVRSYLLCIKKATYNGRILTKELLFYRCPIAPSIFVPLMSAVQYTAEYSYCTAFSFTSPSPLLCCCVQWTTITQHQQHRITVTLYFVVAPL